MLLLLNDEQNRSRYRRASEIREIQGHPDQNFKTRIVFQNGDTWTIRSDSPETIVQAVVTLEWLHARLGASGEMCDLPLAPLSAPRPAQGETLIPIGYILDLTTHPKLHIIKANPQTPWKQTRDIQPLDIMQPDGQRNPARPAPPPSLSMRSSRGVTPSKNALL